MTLSESDSPSRTSDRRSGVLREGMWVMNQERSQKLVPGSLTLWVIKDDGTDLIWVSAETGLDGKIAINAFNGRYGGDPVTVVGSGFVVTLTAPAADTIQVSGDVPGMGPFKETTKLVANGTQMQVHGEVETPEGTQRWYEELDWSAPSPHLAPNPPIARSS